jgi:hypothetical protein
MKRLMKDSRFDTMLMHYGPKEVNETLQFKILPFHGSVATAQTTIIVR